MNISAIIPHYPIREELDIKLKRCVDSLPNIQEKIVVVNFGLGFAKSVNYGLKVAHGEYLFVVNNDVEWRAGNVFDLCKPGIVTSPKVNGKSQPFWGCFFCIPRDIYTTIGGLDERFEMGYYEDDDYMKRLQEANIPMQSVDSCDVFTEGAGTMRYLDSITISQENKKRYEQKWSKN